MADNTGSNNVDQELISLREDREVREWATRLGCSEQGLRAAIKAIGHSAQKVREYLSGKISGKEQR